MKPKANQERIYENNQYITFPCPTQFLDNIECEGH